MTPTRDQGRTLAAEVDLFPGQGRVVVRAVEYHRPFQSPPALADGVGVDLAGRGQVAPFGLQEGPVEAVVQVKLPGHLDRVARRGQRAAPPRGETLAVRQV